MGDTMDETSSASPLDTSVHCIKCDYDLVNLTADRVCPECGTPIEQTLAGTFLKHADPSYLRRLRAGATMFLASVAGILLSLLAILAAMIAVDLTTAQVDRYSTFFITNFAIVSIGFTTLFLVGWWRFSSADPGYDGPDEGERARRSVRVAMSAIVVVYLLHITNAIAWALLVIRGYRHGMRYLFDSINLALGILTILVVAVFYCISCCYITWLARRIPSARVYKRATLLSGLGPLMVMFPLATPVAIRFANAVHVSQSTIVGVFVFLLSIAGLLAPLLALLLFVRLLVWTRRELGAILKQSASPEA